MSIYKDGKLIAGGRQTMPLLSFMWADHQLNDISWLRADTFSWQSGTVYTAVYQHLVDDIDGITAESETVGGITISFYRAPDGHKITTDESAVLSIYNATGVAWYYVLDTVNTRFKLPRTKFGFTGLRDNVGGYVEPELPNITGTFRATLNSAFDADDTGAFTRGANLGAQVTSLKDSYTYRNYEHTLNASDSDSTYKDGATVQPPATEMYLYFYVGQFTQTALENTAGLNAELFNGKADLNLSNTASNIDFVVESQEPTAENGYTWYRKYADGWVEQGGLAAQTSSSATVGSTVVLPVEMSDGNYFITFCNYNTSTGNGSTAYVQDTAVTNVTTTGFTFCRNYNGPKRWEVKGMAA